MTFVSENELNKLSKDLIVWTLSNADFSNVYLKFTGNDEYNLSEVVAFTEKEDAEQMIQILKSSDLFKNKKSALIPCY